MKPWKSGWARVCLNTRSLSMLLAAATVGLVVLQVQVASQTTTSVTQAKDPGVRGGPAGAGEPLFVIRLDARSRQVVVGPREELRTRIVGLSGVNWLVGINGVPITCGVKVRSTRSPVPAVVTPLPGLCAEVELLEGEDAVAPGQACVFYEEGGTRVLGGGWIVSSAPARAVA